jgi:hypothetical protein
MGLELLRRILYKDTRITRSGYQQNRFLFLSKVESGLKQNILQWRV